MGTGHASRVSVRQWPLSKTDPIKNLFYILMNYRFSLEPTERIVLDGKLSAGERKRVGQEIQTIYDYVDEYS